MRFWPYKEGATKESRVDVERGGWCRFFWKKEKGTRRQKGKVRATVLYTVKSLGALIFFPPIMPISKMRETEYRKNRLPWQDLAVDGSSSKVRWASVW